MPAPTLRHVEFSTAGMECTLLLGGIITAASFIMVQWNRRHAQWLMKQGVKVTGSVISNDVQIHLGQNPNASEHFHYRFKNANGQIVSRQLINPPKELKALKADETIVIFHDPNKPSRGYPEIFLQQVAQGRLWKWGLWL